MDQRPKWKRLNSKASRRKHRNRSSEPWAKQRHQREAPTVHGEMDVAGRHPNETLLLIKTAAHVDRQAALPARGPAVWAAPRVPRAWGQKRGLARGWGGRAPLACCLRVSLEAERGGCALHGAPYRGGVGGLGWGCSGRRSGGGGRPRPHRASRGQCWRDGLFMVLATRTYDNCPRPPPQRQCANAEKG